jgi:hypothetical protein
MKKLLLCCAVVLAVLVPGVSIASARTTHPKARFSASLNAAQEVQTPAVVSPARGVAVFRLDGSKLHFHLSARGLGRITMAHIHLGAKGANGDPVVFLFPHVTNGVDGDGFEVGGSVTAADLIGPLAGQKTLANLVKAMSARGAYVNIHTLAHPGGEIRGQIKVGKVDG